MESLTIKSNPYIQGYTNSLSSDKQVGKYELQSKEQIQQATISWLDSYYENDLHVAKTLELYSKEKSLITKVTSLDHADNIHVLKYIINLINKNTEMPENDINILTGYLDRYIPTSNDQDLIKEFSLINSTKTQNAKTLSYNGYQAGYVYAYSYYNTYPSTYADLSVWDGGKDCTNFVSRCMELGGGLAMQDSWYSYRINTVYPQPVSVSQLNYSWNLADPSPWISVLPWSDYWGSQSTVYSYTRSQYINDHENIFYEDISYGDIVLFYTVWGWRQGPCHEMIISRYDSSVKDFKLAGHSAERQAYALLEIFANNSSYGSIAFFCP